LAEVISKLLKCDHSVRLLGIPLPHEFKINVLRVLLSAENFRALAYIVELGNIIQLHLAVLIYIKLVVSFFDKAKSVGVEVTSDSSDKLINTHSAVSVSIKGFNHSF